MADFGLDFAAFRNYNVITDHGGTLRLELTRIGNSRGIRIPKPLIEQCGLKEVVEVRLTPGGLFIAPHRAPRHGWKQAFAASRPAKDEMLLGQVSPNAFDSEEWEW